MPSPATRAHVMIGSSTITYLPDGFGSHDPDTMFAGVDWSTRPEYLSDGQLVLSFGSFLIRTGERNILVDLAAGDINADVPGIAHLEGGSLLRNLAAEGLAPEDIDTVVYTHLHFDHVGWTSDVAPHPMGPAARPASRLTFGHARHLMSEAEWQYWSVTTELGGPDADLVLKPLADVVEFVNDGDIIAPGVSIEATAGHTPGHLAVIVRDPGAAAGEPVRIVGDILHSPAQIADRSLTFTSDVNPSLARAVRDRILGLPDSIIAAGHFTDAVFGRVISSGDRRVWTPVDGA